MTDFNNLFVNLCQDAGVTTQIDQPYPDFFRVSHFLGGREVYIHGIGGAGRGQIDAWYDSLMLYLERAIAQPDPYILNVLVVVNGPTPHGRAKLAAVDKWGNAHKSVPSMTSVVVPKNTAMLVMTFVTLALSNSRSRDPRHPKVVHGSIAKALNWMSEGSDK